jgi:ABC-type transport system substrate-binding protein
MSLFRQPRWILVAASVLALAAFACGSDGDDDASSSANQAPAATQAPAAAPAATQAPVMAAEPKVTRLVIATQPIPVPTNNFLKDGSVVSGFALKPMFESLIGYDAITGALVPQLATAWNVEPNGKSIRFQLRKGVQFHNGVGEFTAADVVHSHAQIIADDSTHTHSRQYKDAATEVVNDHEIIFHLGTPNGEFLQVISELNPSSLDIESASDFAVLGTPQLVSMPLAGTGFYQFTERAEGQYLRMERVPYEHWRVMPDFQELEFRFQAEASTRLAALLAEEVHMTNLSKDHIVTVKSEGMGTISGSQFGLRAFLLFTGVLGDTSYANYEQQNTPCGFAHCDSPFLDVRVRKALNKSINREELNQALFDGNAVPMYMNHMFPNNPQFNPDWKTNFPDEYGFDPAAAKALLAEAGYGPNNPLEIELRKPTVKLPEGPDIMDALAGYWSAIGVKANLNSEDSAALRAGGRAFAYKNHIQFRDDPNNQLQSWRVWNSDVAPRGSGLELPEVNTLVHTLRAQLDIGEQDKVLRQLGDLTYSLHTTGFLFWLKPEIAYNPDIVESYPFPGNTPGAFWSHVELIKGTR